MRLPKSWARLAKPLAGACADHLHRRDYPAAHDGRRPYGGAADESERTELRDAAAAPRMRDASVEELSGEIPRLLEVELHARYLRLLPLAAQLVVVNSNEREVPRNVDAQPPAARDHALGDGIVGGKDACVRRKRLQPFRKIDEVRLALLLRAARAEHAEARLPAAHGGDEQPLAACGPRLVRKPPRVREMRHSRGGESANGALHRLRSLVNDGVGLPDVDGRIEIHDGKSAELLRRHDVRLEACLHHDSNGMVPPEKVAHAEASARAVGDLYGPFPHACVPLEPGELHAVRSRISRAVDVENRLHLGTLYHKWDNAATRQNRRKNGEL